MSDTASEKAVKDAMLKTTQKIFHPQEFRMPGSKKAKNLKEQSKERLEEKSKEAVKRSYINLESSFSPSILSQSFAN